jgi:hypothetical protein
MQAYDEVCLLKKWSPIGRRYDSFRKHERDFTVNTERRHRSGQSLKICSHGLVYILSQDFPTPLGQLTLHSRSGTPSCPGACLFKLQSLEKGQKDISIQRGLVSATNPLKMTEQWSGFHLPPVWVGLGAKQVEPVYFYVIFKPQSGP